MNISDTLKTKAKEMKKKLTAVYYAYKDNRVRFLPKIIIGFTILYALSPIDLIPDFIPIIGYLDDLIIIPALIALAIMLIPKEIMHEAIEKAEKEPIKLSKNWTFGVVFILVWIFIVYIIVKSIIGIIK